MRPHTGYCYLHCHSTLAYIFFLTLPMLSPEHTVLITASCVKMEWGFLSKHWSHTHSKDCLFTFSPVTSPHLLKTQNLNELTQIHELETWRFWYLLSIKSNILTLLRMWGWGPTIRCLQLCPPWNSDTVYLNRMPRQSVTNWVVKHHEITVLQL